MLASIGRVAGRSCSWSYMRVYHTTVLRQFQTQIMPCAVKSVGPFANLFSSATSGRYISLSASNHAKGKDKKKDKKKASAKVDEAEMAELMDVEAFRGRLESVLERLKETFVKQLSVRTSVGSIESLPVPFDGDHYPLNELAQVARKSATLVVINSGTFPQATGDIVRALQAAGMGLNPQQEGTTVYVQIPKVTREHRESLAKGARAAFNTAKDKLKDVQNNQIKAIKKQDGVSEDLLFNVQSQVTAMTAQYVTAAESLLKAKTAELLGEK